MKTGEILREEKEYPFLFLNFYGFHGFRLSVCSFRIWFSPVFTVFIYPWPPRRACGFAGLGGPWTPSSSQLPGRLRGALQASRVRAMARVCRQALAGRRRGHSQNHLRVGGGVTSLLQHSIPWSATTPQHARASRSCMLSSPVPSTRTEKMSHLRLRHKAGTWSITPDPPLSSMSDIILARHVSI